jgi:hypothetical protein
MGPWEKFRVRNVRDSIDMEDHNLDVGGGGEGLAVRVNFKDPTRNSKVRYNLRHGTGVAKLGRLIANGHSELQDGWVLYYYEDENYSGKRYCFDSNGKIPRYLRSRINSARVYVGEGCYD